MTPRKKYSFYIEDEQAEALKHIKERDGVLESEPIRRALKIGFGKRASASRERSASARQRAGAPNP